MSPPVTPPPPIKETSDAVDASPSVDKAMPPLPLSVPAAAEQAGVQSKVPEDAKSTSFNILRKKSKSLSSAVSPQAQSFAEQVRGAAMVMADIRTNVIVRISPNLLPLAEI